MLVWSSGFISWTLMILPSDVIKAMLSGRMVFCIQKLLLVSALKSNSIPSSGGMLARNISPSSRDASVLATSTVMAMFSPLLLTNVTVALLSCGAAVSVACAPGIGVPTSAVGGTQVAVAPAGAAEVGTA